MIKKTWVVMTLVIALGTLTGCANTENAVESYEKDRVEAKLLKEKRRVKGIKPIRKIVVNTDFNIEDLELTDVIETNDPGAKSEWFIEKTNVYKAWDKDNQERSITVAVIDTGVDYNHPDLVNRVDKEKGYDFVNDTYDAMDDNGHGTHVAGIIAAEMNNAEGIVGVAGDLDVTIIPIKVLDSEGSGDLDAVVKGIKHAIDAEADIINLSLGAVADDEDIKEAINDAWEKGILVVAAAGNDKRNCDNYIPASLPEVYTVAATSFIDKMARFSNFGESVDIGAPGVKILSTVPGGGYEAWDGTSMAAPIVSGSAAILMAYDSDLMPQDVMYILNKSARDVFKEGDDRLSGSGFIDAVEAVNILNNEY